MQIFELLDQYERTYLRGFSGISTAKTNKCILAATNIVKLMRKETGTPLSIVTD